MYLSYDYFTGAVFESEPGTPYNITSILGLASAFASKAADGTAKPVAVIARDTASYSEAVYHLFISALLGGGVNVVELGIMPAPAVSWICGDRGAQMGFFIRSTPGTGGRVKITVYGQDGCVPERDFLESVNAASAAPPTVNTDGNMGRNIPVTNEINRYMLHVTDASDNRLTGLKVALDCANGAVLSVVEQIFTKLGAQCFLTANKPNGFNAGEKVCAANASNLSDFVLKNLCDVGFSFDNAGLRCVATDETGDFADGSVIAAVIAHHMSQFGTLENNTALFSANTNFGVKKYLKQVGAKFSLFENSEGLQALIESTKSNLVSDSRGFLRVTDRDMLSDG
ncbi:MAG: hypothetical protein IJL87_01055, partial [Clostridia bacterium]|nr:hypothetical protein [Clostridia bacterium]